MTGDWSRFELAFPWLLLAAPLAIFLLWPAAKRGVRRVRYSAVDLVDGLPVGWRARLAWLPMALLVVGALLTSLALARPRIGDERTVVRAEGIAIELVVDVSGSMRALDLKGPKGEEATRLDVVKSVVREFVSGGPGLPGRPTDRIGLTVFAGYADAVCPLTLDHRLLTDSLAAQRTAQSRFEDGTSIGQGLAVALGRLEDSEVPSRVVVLLTDGENNDEETDPLAVADVAREMGVKVYTVGVGSNGPARIRLRDERGNEFVQTVQVQLDEKLLREIAKRTNGVYQRAGTLEALRAIYAEIDRLERVEHEGVTYRRWNELYTWPLAAGLLCWLLGLLSEATLLRRAG